MTGRHPIPEAALEHHVAILGKTGSGKSYAAQGLVERLIEKRQRVCVIDPTDRYWGLRLLSDGKSPSGHEIVIFGGQRADLPLGAAHGAAIAEIVGTSATPVILAMRLMTVGERTRFFTDFAETLLRRNEGPLHLVIDEAHLFAPQTKVASVESGKMLHAANNLVSLGRGIGLRIMLLSQRPAKLHKDSLTQVETLVAFRLIAPQDRAAIKEWVREWADEATGADMMASLPSLPTGTAWVWAPELDVLRKGKFPKIRTFDSGVPLSGSRKGPVLAPIDVATVRGKLETVAREAIANDPKTLRVEIARLKKQMEDAAKAAAKAGQVPDRHAIEEAERRGDAKGYGRGKIEGYAAAAADIRQMTKALSAALGPALEAIGALRSPVRQIEAWAAHAAKNPPASVPRSMTSVPPRSPFRVNPNAPISVSRQAVTVDKDGAGLPGCAVSNDGNYSRPQMKVLRSLAMWRSLGHDAPSREMVAAVAGYSPTSGGFNNLLGSLKTAGAIDYPQPGLVVLVADGGTVMTREEGADLLLARLSNPQKKIVGALLGADIRSRAEVGEDTGYSPTSGGFNNLLGSLRTLGLIDYPRAGCVALTAWAQELLADQAGRIGA